MANETKITVGAQFCFRDSTDFNPAASTTDYRVGTPTYGQLDLTSLANAAGRESAKIDLGAARAEAHAVYGAFEMAATPVVGERIDVYWYASPEATAGDANPHDIGGADAAAPSGYGTLAELLANLIFIGSLITTDDATTTVQHGFIGILYSPTRYGGVVVVNESDAAFVANADEHHVLLEEILPQYQTA